MSNISAVRDWLILCPLLDDSAPLRVDFVSSDVPSYSIEPLEEVRLEKTYTDGASLKDFRFAFKAALPICGDDARIRNRKFFYDFTQFLDDSSRRLSLPLLGQGKEPVSISALGNGTIAYRQETSETGIYQIICSLKFINK